MPRITRVVPVVLTLAASAVAAAPMAHAATTRPQVRMHMHLAGRTNVRTIARNAGPRAAVRAAARAAHFQVVPHATTAKPFGPVVVPLFVETTGKLADFQGDGHPEVVVIRGTGTTAHLSFRRGDTGHEEWKTTIHDFAALTVMRRAGGQLEVVTMAETDTPPAVPGDPHSLVLTVDAFRGSGGNPLWEATHTGSATETSSGIDSATDLPIPVGVLSRGPGKAENLLVETVTGTNGLVNASTTTAFSVVSGYSGFESASGDPVDGFATTEVLGDVDGDKVWDYLAPAVELDARSGATGETLWSRTGLSTGEPATTLSDVTGDGSPDILFSTFTAHPRTSLLNGANGATKWTKNGDIGYPIGDVNKDGRIDVVVEREVQTSTKAGVGLIAWTGSAHELWSRSVTVAVPKTGSFSVGILTAAAGFVDTDKRLDSYVQLMSKIGTQKPKTTREVVRGGSGKTIDVRGLGHPLYGPVDAHGDDFGGFTTAVHWQFTVSDPLSGKPLFTFKRTAAEKTRLGLDGAVKLTGDDHAEVLLTVVSANHERSYVIDGHTHKARWSVGR
jgi:hypothetical protein